MFSRLRTPAVGTSGTQPRDGYGPSQRFSALHTAHRLRIVHAPTEHVWRVLDDFGGVWRYNPAVESSRIVNDIERGVGACRECVFESGGRIEETIVDYDQDAGYTVEFTDTGSYPLVSNLVHIEIEAADDHHTLVTVTARPKYGPLGWLLGRLVMRRQFEEQFGAVLDGLAAHIHTDDAGVGTVATA